MERSFPVGPRAAFTPALLDFLTQYYDLGSVLTVTDLGGTYNLNLALQTAHGTVVARVYRPWLTRQRLLGLQELKNRLLASQIPVALPLRTTTGQTLIEYDQRLIELELFIPHDSITQTVLHYRQRFTFFAQLHVVLSQLGNQITIPPPLVQNYALPQTLLSWLAAAKHTIAQQHDPRRQVALAICETAESLLHDIAVWWGQTGQSLPRQLIHGDYGLGNVLFAQDQIAAVVDWDFMAVHERVFDLAYALYWMCDDLARGNKNFEHAWQWVQEMVSCYQASNQQSLTKAEQEALPIEMARVPLYWIGEAAWLNDPIEAVLSRANQIAFASWLMDHRKELF